MTNPVATQTVSPRPPASVRDPLSAPGEIASRPLAYMRQLDGLRAIAVAAVFVEHYAWTVEVKRAVPWGVLGTRLFFVLSGYLITGILLACRRQVAAGRSTIGRELRQFYARRTLRIFPIYYLTLAAACLISPSLRAQVGWFAVYLQNVLFARAGFYTGASHLWTLAVEEQFYLAWPLLVMLVPDRWLVRTMVGAAAVGPAVRLGAVLAAAASGRPIPFWADVDVLTPNNLDTLAVGGLLATMGAAGGGTSARASAFARGCLWAGLPLMAFLLAASPSGRMDGAVVVVRNTACGLTFTWVVAAASRGFAGPVGRLLSAAPLVLIGRISYGLYLYHFFLINSVRRAATRLGLGGFDHGWLFVLANVAASLGLAVASWFLIERPINGLKRLFPYDRRESPAG